LHRRAYVNANQCHPFGSIRTEWVACSVACSGSQPRGLDPKLGRGEHPDGSRVFYQNQFIFYFRRIFWQKRKRVEKKVISRFHCIWSLCRAHVLLHSLIYIAELKFQFIPFLFTTT
jgi:hypothetical protein